jgi:hypothetical protein
MFMHQILLSSTAVATLSSQGTARSTASLTSIDWKFAFLMLEILANLTRTDDIYHIPLCDDNLYKLEYGMLNKVSRTSLPITARDLRYGRIMHDIPRDSLNSASSEEKSLLVSMVALSFGSIRPVINLCWPIGSRVRMSKTRVFQLE